MKLEDIKTPTTSSSSSQAPKEASFISKALSWFFGVFFCLSAAGLMFSPTGSFLAGLFMAVAGLVLLPPVGGKRLSKGVKAGVIIGSFILSGMVLPKDNSSGGSTSSTPEVQINVPTTQSNFVQVLQEAHDLYSRAGNEFQKSAIRTNRAGSIRNALGGRRSFKDWVGKITEMSTTGEGKGILSIQLHGSDVVIKTWNNALSDIGSNSLIEQHDPLYGRLMSLKKGLLVKVSGTFGDGKDFVQEASLTEQGAMGDPEFIVRFKTVEPFN